MSKPKGDYQCPYCGTGVYDDESSYVDVCEAEVDCPECEKVFYLSSSVSVDYESKGDCKLLKAMPHKLVKKPDWLSGSSQDYECETCKQEFYDWHLPGGKYPKLKEGDFVIVTESSRSAEKEGKS